MVMEVVRDLLILIVISGLVFAGMLAIVIWIKNLTKKITYLRLFVQIISFIAITLTLTILAQWAYLVFGVIILLTVFFGRFFCGWICPLGLYMDLITYIRKAFKIRYWNLSDKANRYLHKLRYIIVAGILTLPFYIGNPLDPNNWTSFLLFENPYKPLIPFFLGPLEPLLLPWPGDIEFYGWSLSFPYVRLITDFLPESIISISVLIFLLFVLITSFMVRRFWCRFCPTAVSIAAIDRFKKSKWMPMLHINKVEEKCTKCGICKRVCHVQVTDVYEEKGGELTTSICTLCLRCIEMCPYEDCLKLNMAGKTLFKSRNWLEPSTIE
jgi:polyferredoxin